MGVIRKLTKGEEIYQKGQQERNKYKLHVSYLLVAYGHATLILFFVQKDNQMTYWYAKYGCNNVLEIIPQALDFIALLETVCIYSKCLYNLMK